MANRAAREPPLQWVYGDRWQGRWRRAFEYASPNPSDTVSEHQWMDRLDLLQNGRQVGWLSRDDVRLATIVFVMRKADSPATAAPQSPSASQ